MYISVVLRAKDDQWMKGVSGMQIGMKFDDDFDNRFNWRLMWNEQCIFLNGHKVSTGSREIIPSQHNFKFSELRIVIDNTYNQSNISITISEVKKNQDYCKYLWYFSHPEEFLSTKGQFRKIESEM